MNDTEQCEDYGLVLSFHWKALLIFAYSFVGVASLVGNLAVLMIVGLRREMQTVTNMFIGSVSAADLVITSFSLWATPLTYYNRMWKFGRVVCHIVTVVQGASLLWVPFTLAAIAVDRYLLVASPFRKQMSVGTCLLVIISIWFGAFVVLVPMITHLQYLEYGNCHAYCIEVWIPHQEYRMVYGVAVLLTRSALPLVIISWCHWRIASILNSQTNKFIRNTSHNTNDIKRKQRLQTLLLAMVVIFAVSNVPIDLFNVIQDMELYQMKTVTPYVKHFIFFFSHWIAMAGTLLNPLVYAWWNENFRRQIQGCVAEIRGQDSFKKGLYSVVISGTQRSTARKHTMEELRSIQVIEECEDDVQV